MSCTPPDVFWMFTKKFSAAIRLSRIPNNQMVVLLAVIEAIAEWPASRASGQVRLSHSRLARATGLPRGRMPRILTLLEHGGYLIRRSTSTGTWFEVTPPETWGRQRVAEQDPTYVGRGLTPERHPSASHQRDTPPPTGVSHQRDPRKKGEERTGEGRRAFRPDFGIEYR